MNNSWSFLNQNDTSADFVLKNPHHSSDLYFPLANEAGMMSAITPTLNGDIKTSQRTFFNLPVSVQDLHNTKSGRNFWVYIKGAGAWSAAGASARQLAEDCDQVTLEAGLLWHKVTRENATLGIRAEIVSFVPANALTAELMRVTLTNIGTTALEITPTAAVPIYGRSAENLRDHRHVTSLLNRTLIVREGVELTPVMTFDERGHRPNLVTYAVYGAEGDGTPPQGAIPLVEDFIGEGGSLEWPRAVAANEGEWLGAGKTAEGGEAIGALRFAGRRLAPGESAAYVVALSIAPERETGRAGVLPSLNGQGFERLLDENKAFWAEKLRGLSFAGGDRSFDGWMRWVSLQPILRRIYGCSFLPHHDYGKGGRGWRDLWQDCLALLLLETDAVRPLLLNNFGGVRMDGTNATIIGAAPGEFIADRNNISRVWSDHGVWPFFTTLLYINQSGDLGFLLEQCPYFKDRLTMRCTQADERWSPDYGSRQKDEAGGPITGTVLEHILVQHLTAFFNAGDYGNLRIEGADWNDAFDMAKDKGETVAFTAFCAGNLLELSELLLNARRVAGVAELSLAEELMPLLDSLSAPVDYADPAARRALLHRYAGSCAHSVSGKKAVLSTERVAEDLRKKGEWLRSHLRGQEWIGSAEGYHWFNGYYDNAGKPLEGDHPSGVRMTLTGQVFPLMMGIATDEQAREAARAARHYLFNKGVGGYRLNTDFKEVKLDMGRCFGFAYGTKENGAVFCHMAVMFAFALYRRGLAREGWEALQALYGLAANFETSRIYPGVPEYFNGKGRGQYHYLTGTASWLLLLMLTEVYGVRGELGSLALRPKLAAEQFDGQGNAAVRTVFAGRHLTVEYQNPRRLDWGKYRIAEVCIDGAACGVMPMGGGAVIARGVVEALSVDAPHTVTVRLAASGVKEEF